MSNWKALRAGLTCLLIGAVACEGVSARPTTRQAAAQTATAARAAEISGTRRTAITTAVDRVAPAVVTVQTERIQRASGDFFDLFFGGRERVVPGLGSGFVVRPDGVIVTNAHVVAGASRISVAMRDGTTYSAELIGADEPNDLAVIRIDARDLPTAPLGTSKGLLLGEWVVAIGNPFGFVLGNTEPSVTAGVVSGVGRNLAATRSGAGVYVDMIQTDASINPGNSGGPLVNAVGEVVGVNTAIFSPSGGSIGVGFAIPIDRVKRVVDDLVEHGTIRRPWDGVNLRLAAPGGGREALIAGATVASVTPGSPAARAGIRAGDVIVGSRDRAIRNAYDWEAERLDFRVGDAVPVVLRRNGRELTVTLRVADLPDVTAPRVAVFRELQLVTLTPAIRQTRNVRSASGALVVSASERVSQQLGILVDDVILQVNNTRVTTAEEAAQALNYFAGRSPILVYLERQGQLWTAQFRLQ
jgi:serine protease Do